jgi:hypothetical protein
MVFKPIFSLENLMKYTCMNYSINIIVYSRASPKNKSTFSLVEYTWHILESMLHCRKQVLKAICI